MKCLFEHNWGWPRRRGGKDMQVCVICGRERESLVRFDGPRYRKTQEAPSAASNLTIHFSKPLQTASASAN
jgi:hypothetical protein